MRRRMIQICTLLILAAIGIAAGCSGNQSGEQLVDDTAISTQIKGKLASDVQLSTLTDVEVNTTNGVVTLAGQVSSEDVKRRAEEISKSINGVVRVNNNLQVQGQPPAAPAP